MPDLVIPRLRPEWLKMQFPDEPIVVGVIANMGKQWVCFHATQPSQYNERFDSPAGVDTGTIKYLVSVGVNVFLHYPKGMCRVYAATTARLHDMLVAHKDCHDTVTRAGQFRTRVFMPRLQWTTFLVKEPYDFHKFEPPSLSDETRIDPEGVVLWRR